MIFLLGAPFRADGLRPLIGCYALPQSRAKNLQLSNIHLSYANSAWFSDE
jgi:hypothetical protein